MTYVEIQAERGLPTAERLRRLLQAIAHDVPVQFGGVCSFYEQLNRLESIVEYAAAPLPSGDQFRLRRWLEAFVATDDREIIVLTPDNLIGTVFQSGLVFRLLLAGELIGVLVLLTTTPAAYTLADVQRISPWVEMARLVVENQHLHDNQAAAHVIQSAARIIGDAPSPQTLLNLLRDHLFNPHVVLGLLLFYGPLQENRPNAPFDYLEVQGSWLRRYGEGVGQGIRFYLDQYADLIDELDTHRVLTFPNIKAFQARLDPLVRAFLRAERVRAVTFIALHAPQRRLGIIAIGTDRPHPLTPLELDNFRTVSEFLAVGTMAHVLQQQHDQIQRARSALLDAVNDGVMMVLPNPHNPYVLTVNDCFTRMFQLNQLAAQGMSLAELLNRIQLPDDARQELRRQWLSSPVNDSSVLKGEFAMMHPDGYPVTIAWYSAPVYHAGRVMGRIYTFHDISPERTSAMLRANFISWVSHELRTPLTSIKGFSEFILEAAGDQLPPVARDYTEIILQSATHLNRVFTDIIEIARADTGQLRLNITDAHLPDIILNTVARLEAQANAHGHTISVEMDDHLPPVRVDTSRLAQVLSHLLLNAIQYTPPDTRIHISTHYVGTRSHLPASAPPDVMLPGVLVTVADEGAGIAPEEIEQVFLPFFRTKEARASKIAGTGLGLTMARSILELHRGKIWVEGRRRGRRGATFLFTLPTAEG